MSKILLKKLFNFIIIFKQKLYTLFSCMDTHLKVMHVHEALLILTCYRFWLRCNIQDRIIGIQSTNHIELLTIKTWRCFVITCSRLTLVFLTNTDVMLY